MSTKARKTEKLKPVYLITGSDATKVEKAARRLKERVIADSGSDLNVDTFDASQQQALEVVQAANTMPFGDGVRLVLVTNAGAWNKPDKDTIVAYLADPQPQTVLALVGGGIKKNEGLFKAVESAGQVLAFEAPRPANLPHWAQEQAAAVHLKLGHEEARRLVFLTGSDQRAIISELEKLSAYLGSGSVEMEDIEGICWVSPEVRIWDLTDALGRKDRGAVFRHLEALLAERTAPAAIFFSIAKHMRMLARVTEASERGEDAVSAALALGMKPYPAKKIAEQSRNFTDAGLKLAIGILAGLDADIRGRADMRQDLALEVAVARILDAVK